MSQIRRLVRYLKLNHLIWVYQHNARKDDLLRNVDPETEIYRGRLFYWYVNSRIYFLIRFSYYVYDLILTYACFWPFLQHLPPVKLLRQRLVLFPWTRSKRWPLPSWRILFWGLSPRYFDRGRRISWFTENVPHWSTVEVSTPEVTLRARPRTKSLRDPRGLTLDLVYPDDVQDSFSFQFDHHFEDQQDDQDGFDHELPEEDLFGLTVRYRDFRRSRVSPWSDQLRSRTFAEWNDRLTQFKRRKVDPKDEWTRLRGLRHRWRDRRLPEVETPVIDRSSVFYTNDYLLPAGDGPSTEDYQPPKSTDDPEEQYNEEPRRLRNVYDWFAHWSDHPRFDTQPVLKEETYLGYLFHHRWAFPFDPTGRVRSLLKEAKFKRWHRRFKVFPDRPLEPNPRQEKYILYLKSLRRRYLRYRVVESLVTRYRSFSSRPRAVAVDFGRRLKKKIHPRWRWLRRRWSHRYITLWWPVRRLRRWRRRRWRRFRRRFRIRWLRPRVGLIIWERHTQRIRADWRYRFGEGKKFKPRRRLRRLRRWLTRFGLGFRFNRWLWRRHRVNFFRRRRRRLVQKMDALLFRARELNFEKRVRTFNSPGAVDNFFRFPVSRRQWSVGNRRRLPVRFYRRYAVNDQRETELLAPGLAAAWSVLLGCLLLVYRREVALVEGWGPSVGLLHWFEPLRFEARFYQPGLVDRQRPFHLFQYKLNRSIIFHDGGVLEFYLKQGYDWVVYNITMNGTHYADPGRRLNWSYFFNLDRMPIDSRSYDRVSTDQSPIHVWEYDYRKVRFPTAIDRRYFKYKPLPKNWQSGLYASYFHIPRLVSYKAAISIDQTLGAALRSTVYLDHRRLLSDSPRDLKFNYLRRSDYFEPCLIYPNWVTNWQAQSRFQLGQRYFNFSANFGLHLKHRSLMWELPAWEVYFNQRWLTRQNPDFSLADRELAVRHRGWLSFPDWWWVVRLWRVTLIVGGLGVIFNSGRARLNECYAWLLPWVYIHPLQRGRLLRRSASAGWRPSAAAIELGVTRGRPSAAAVLRAAWPVTRRLKTTVCYRPVTPLPPWLLVRPRVEYRSAERPQPTGVQPRARRRRRRSTYDDVTYRRRFRKVSHGFQPLRRELKKASFFHPSRVSSRVVFDPVWWVHRRQRTYLRRRYRASLKSVNLVVHPLFEGSLYLEFLAQFDRPSRSTGIHHELIDEDLYVQAAEDHGNTDESNELTSEEDSPFETYTVGVTSSEGRPEVRLPLVEWDRRRRSALVAYQRFRSLPLEWYHLSVLSETYFDYDRLSVVYWGLHSAEHPAYHQLSLTSVSHALLYRGVTRQPAVFDRRRRSTWGGRTRTRPVRRPVFDYPSGSPALAEGFNLDPGLVHQTYDYLLTCELTTLDYPDQDWKLDDHDSITLETSAFYNLGYRWTLPRVYLEVLLRPVSTLKNQGPCLGSRLGYNPEKELLAEDLNFKGYQNFDQHLGSYLTDDYDEPDDLFEWLAAADDDYDVNSLDLAYELDDDDEFDFYDDLDDDQDSDNIPRWVVWAVFHELSLGHRPSEFLDRSSSPNVSHQWRSFAGRLTAKYGPRRRLIPELILEASRRPSKPKLEDWYLELDRPRSEIHPESYSFVTIGNYTLSEEDYTSCVVRLWALEQLFLNDGYFGRVTNA